VANVRRRLGSPPDDYLYRSRLTYRQNREELAFDVAEGLFSAAAVDAGTAFLLRWLGGPAFEDAGRVLDLGCGYGPIGIALARFRDGRSALGVDRDALAVEYTEWNAALNGVAGRVEARGGIGYADLPTDERVDLVASNIPAKIGPAALDHFLFGAGHRLAAGGRVAVVVIDRLRAQVEQSLDRTGAEVLERHDNRGYAVFAFRPPADAPSGDDPYGRGAPRSFHVGGAEWQVRPAYTLPEFDTLAYGTTEAMKLVGGVAEDYVVAGVGHGHLAGYLLATTPSARVELVDRDLLALRAATDTVRRTFGPERLDTVRTRHAARPAGGRRVDGDCVVLRLDEREPVAVSAEAILRLVGEAPERSTLVLHGRAADISRSLEIVRRRGSQVTVTKESRSRGHGAVLLTVRMRRSARDPG
jgi:16S rRNA (guanine1207-N2)-methyltransferase